jgi:hypothetical protein
MKARDAVMLKLIFHLLIMQGIQIYLKKKIF